MLAGKVADLQTSNPEHLKLKPKQRAQHANKVPDQLDKPQNVNLQTLNRSPYTANNYHNTSIVVAAS